MSLFVSVITGGTNSHQTISEEANFFATDFVGSGVVGSFTNSGGLAPTTGSFSVNAQGSPNNTISIGTGPAYILATPTGQGSQVLRVRNTAIITQTINPNVSGSTKFDWIYISIDPNNAVNSDVQGDNVASIFVSRSSSNSTDNGTPPAFGFAIAVVTVANNFTTITNGNISDHRSQASISTGATLGAGWTGLSGTLTYAGNNGNKEFLVNTSVDLTGTLSPGMRLKVGRGTTPPSQCMAFASASSQYATKASPAGITFTAAFTCEAWLFLQNYVVGGNQLIVNRSDVNTAGGWWFGINPSGQVRIIYGTGTSFTDFISTPSVPLNRWVHVAGVVTSTSSKTGAVYMNGTLMTSTSSVTAAAALVQQAIDLRVGAQSNAATSYLNGYLSEVRVWSVAQTQASIQSNMTINLVGSETNLVALYQGNGNFNDATSNANNLTATNGAIATQASNPYYNTEYGILTKITSSQMTIFTGTDYTIPNVALLNGQYAISRTPYGFPSARNKWLVDVIGIVRLSQAVAVNVWANLGFQLAIPTGEWEVFISGHTIATDAGATFLGCGITLSTANNTKGDQRLTVGATYTNASSAEQDNGYFKEGDITTTAITSYFLNSVPLASGATVFQGDSSAAGEATVIKAKSAYF